MVMIINVCSSKGGVGKTTIASNLGLALQRFGKRVAIVDCNFTASHLSLSFGNYSYPRTLNHFLRNECQLEDAVHTHVSGLRIVPASLELDELMEINVNNLRESLQKTFRDYDVVLLDSAPGLGKEAMISMQAADGALFVANPYIPSLVDVLKCNQLIGRMGQKPAPLGVVLNRVSGKKYEVSTHEIGQFVDMPVVGTVPEDEKVLESANKKTLVTFSHPYSDASQAIFEIAAALVGVQYKRPNRLEKLLARFRSQPHERPYRHTYPISHERYYGMIR